MRTVERAIRVLTFLCVLFLFPVLRGVGDEPIASGMWFAGDPGGEVLRAQDDPSPRSVFALPQLPALRWEEFVPGAVRVGAGGGVIVIEPGGDSSPGYAGGGSIAVSALGRRAVWGGGAAVYRDDLRSIVRISANAGRPVGALSVAGVSVHGTVVHTDDDGSEPALSIDVGVARRLDGIAGIERATVHAALLEVGPESVGSAFIPMVGVGMMPWRSELLSLDVGIGVAGRSSSTARAGVGTALSIGDRVRVGATVPVVEEGEWFDRAPSALVEARFPLGGERSTRAAVSVQPTAHAGLLAAFEVDALIASGDDSVPEFTVVNGGSSASVVSPQGSYESFQFSVEAIDNRAIASLSIEVVDGDGALVRQATVLPAAPQWGAMGISERLSYPLRVEKINGSIAWSPGTDADDGLIRFLARAEDQSGNETQIELGTVAVDTTPPTVNGTYIVLGADGVARDDRVLDPEGSVESSVAIGGADSSEFLVEDEAGRVIRTLFPEHAADSERRYEVVWNGVGDDGFRVPDGVYRIVVLARDAAGNHAQEESPEVLVRGIHARMTLGFSAHVVNAESARQRNEIVVTPALEPLLGLRDWRIDLVDAAGTTLRSWSGIDLLPEELVLDDLIFPEDGVYRLIGQAVYLDGHQVSVESGAITVDRTPPPIAIAVAENRVRRGVDAAVIVFVENNADATETSVVLREAGVPLRSAVSARRSPTIEMPLVDEDGRFLPAGRYTLVARATDEHGNVGATAPIDVEVLPGEIGVQLALALGRFSPNDDGRLDRLPIYVSVEDERTIAGYTLTIGDERGSSLVNRSGRGAPPQTIEWDGRDNSGRPVGDGRYTVGFEVEYEDGTAVTANRSSVTIDTTLRVPEIALESSIISPDGDGRRDSLVVDVGAFDEDTVERYLLVLKDQTVVSRRAIHGAEEVEWIPRFADNRVISDGEYDLVVEVRDDAGNSRRGSVASFEVVTRPVSAYLSLSQPAFAPNGDDADETIAIRPVVPEPHGMTGWTLVVSAVGSDRVVRRFEGLDGEVPTELVWDGASVDGETVADGRYVARFTAEWLWGARVEVESVPFVLDRTAPELRVTTTPELFSPDGDGTDDVLHFRLAIEEMSAIRYWYLEILDPRGRFFYDDGSGGTPPGVVTWDGYARNGERVISAEVYSWRIEVADELGNMSTRSGTFDTDVLIERTERGYRIQVPGITFLPNSAQLVVAGTAPEARRNTEVLDRIYEILQRFPGYTIIVEGHAVNVSGTEREEREELQPLSLARARSVREALITRGIAPRRLEAVGRGGSEPLVPHTDEENRWKNRRVDFLLVR